jgi:high-affinity Fe2+/Pb2+ permease
MSDTEKNHATVICDFIDDGYTHGATIEAEAESNGPLTFTYRPALPEQVSKLIDANANDEEYMRLAINMLAKLVLSWDLKDRQGAVVKINRDNLARVNRKLLIKIIDQVFFKVPVEDSLKN